MDYNEFAERIKTKYPEYKEMDNMELAQRMVAKYPQYNDVTFDNPENIQRKGIDLTPSGLVKQATAGIAAPIRAARFNETLPEAYNRAREIQEESVLNKFSPAVDIGAALALPEAKVIQGAGKLAKIGNMAATGAYQGGLIGGLGSLKEKGDLSGIIGGTAIGAGIGAGLPIVGMGATKALKLIPAAGGKISQVLGRVQPETLAQAVKPNSQALDLTRDSAQNLLMNTTERVQNAYNNLLNKRGQAVNDAVENLRGNEYRIPVQDLQQDITQTFDQYGGDLINPARNMTGKLENNLNELIASGGKETPLQGLSGATDITEATISPIDLEKTKQQIGNMINWSDDTARNYQNPILEQIYGKYNDRLSQLSPELQAANQEFANLRAFKKNEGLRRILKPGDNIDNASSVLRNYNSTVTKGNTGRNIRDLENVLIQEGKNPFLNDIDDVNAAMDLLNMRATGDSWLANLATQLTRPALKVVRSINRSGLPDVYTRLNQKVPRTLVPLLYTAPRLYGGVSNVE